MDGDSGMVAWSYSIPCHMEETPATSAAAVDQKSVFLFWAEGLSAASPNPVSEHGRVPLSLCQMAAALGAALPGLQWAGRVSWGLRLGFEVNKLRFRKWAGPQGGKAGAGGRWAEGEGSPGGPRERSSDTRKAGLRMLSCSTLTGLRRHGATSTRCLGILSKTHPDLVQLHTADQHLLCARDLGVN